MFELFIGCKNTAPPKKEQYFCEDYLLKNFFNKIGLFKK